MAALAEWLTMAKTSKSAKPTKKTAAKKAAAKPAKAPSAKKVFAPAVSPTPPLGRETLPIPDPQHVGLTTYDARDPNTEYPPITMLRPPKLAPNVLIVLIDDVGSAASSAFGGPCKTPVAERLAANGLKLNRFHTTALCSPTRQALLTGRNHHSVGMGGITEIATAHFYGFIGGEANQYYPGLYEGPRRLNRKSRPKRVTPSPRISPIAPSPGCASRRS